MAKSVPEIYLESPRGGYEKDGDYSEWSVWCEDWPDPLFEGSRDECEAFITTEVNAGRAIRCEED